MFSKGYEPQTEATDYSTYRSSEVTSQRHNHEPPQQHVEKQFYSERNSDARKWPGVDTRNLSPSRQSKNISLSTDKHADNVSLQMERNNEQSAENVKLATPLSSSSSLHKDSAESIDNATADHMKRKKENESGDDVKAVTPPPTRPPQFPSGVNGLPYDQNCAMAYVEVQPSVYAPMLLPDSGPMHSLSYLPTSFGEC